MANGGNGMSSPDVVISRLGEAAIPSPLNLSTQAGDALGDYVSDAVRVRYNVEEGGPVGEDFRFEKAGPRGKLFFQPSYTRAAIVTCGGLCPGLNSVIRSAYRQLWLYGVREVLGIRYGYAGLNPANGFEPVRLDDDMVDDIHRDGGTILGSSRGSQPVPVMLDTLERMGVNILLTIGGDGTQKGAHAIAVEALKRKLPLAVVGIPKTIDNDILYTRRTFGFTTAVDRARDVLSSAHHEARSYHNGIALVRLMGRDSGFIAAVATLASQEVNFALVPEVPFRLDGPNGFLAALESRIHRKRHALIAVAEGAGQDLVAGLGERKDASGNVVHEDVGLILKEKIAAYFKEKGVAINLKYMDPSYFIRSAPANSEDAWLCDQYARHAVHAALTGRTDVLIGYWNTFIHVPMLMATAYRRKIDQESLLWSSVLSSTGQPPVMM